MILNKQFHTRSKPMPCLCHVFIMVFIFVIVFVFGLWSGHVSDAMSSRSQVSWVPLMVFSKSLCLCLLLFGQVMSPHYSNQMSERSQVSLTVFSQCLCLCLCHCLFCSGHVSSSLWSNVSNVTRVYSLTSSQLKTWHCHCLPTLYLLRIVEKHYNGELLETCETFDQSEMAWPTRTSLQFIGRRTSLVFPASKLGRWGRWVFLRWAGGGGGGEEPDRREFPTSPRRNQPLFPSNPVWPRTLDPCSEIWTSLPREIAQKSSRRYSEIVQPCREHQLRWWAADDKGSFVKLMTVESGGGAPVVALRAPWWRRGAT